MMKNFMKFVLCSKQKPQECLNSIKQNVKWTLFANPDSWIIGGEGFH